MHWLHCHAAGNYCLVLQLTWVRWLIEPSHQTTFNYPFPGNIVDFLWQRLFSCGIIFCFFMACFGMIWNVIFCYVMLWYGNRSCQVRCQDPAFSRPNWPFHAVSYHTIPDSLYIPDTVSQCCNVSTMHRDTGQQPWPQIVLFTFAQHTTYHIAWLSQ